MRGRRARRRLRGRGRRALWGARNSGGIIRRFRQPDKRPKGWLQNNGIGAPIQQANGLAVSRSGFTGPKCEMECSISCPVPRKACPELVGGWELLLLAQVI